MITSFVRVKSFSFLDTEEHRDVRVSLPKDFSFCESVDTVPIGFSELLWVSMYYPVLFGVSEGELFPFAVMGLNGKNFYIQGGEFKVDVIPSAVKLYPFLVMKTSGEDSKRQWTVGFDREYENKEGERLFDDDGKETPFFLNIKNQLQNFAYDLEMALAFSKELADMNCLKILQNLEVSTKKGNGVFKNVFIGDIENLSKLSPERLYYLNTKGYLPVLYSIYFSVRNFRLFDFL